MKLPLERVVLRQGDAGCVPPMCMHQLAEAGASCWDFTKKWVPVPVTSGIFMVNFMGYEHPFTNYVWGSQLVGFLTHGWTKKNMGFPCRKVDFRSKSKETIQFIHRCSLMQQLLTYISEFNLVISPGNANHHVGRFGLDMYEFS